MSDFSEKCQILGSKMPEFWGVKKWSNFGSKNHQFWGVPPPEMKFSGGVDFCEKKPWEYPCPNSRIFSIFLGGPVNFDGRGPKNDDFQDQNLGNTLTKIGQKVVNFRGPPWGVRFGGQKMVKFWVKKSSNFGQKSSNFGKFQVRGSKIQKFWSKIQKFRGSGPKNDGFSRFSGGDP